MTNEKVLQGAFNEALNFIHKIVGEYVNNYQPIVSPREEQKDYLVSIRAMCKQKHCKHVVMASISTSEEKWSRQLVDTFIMRAEFHAKSAHKIKAEWYRLPTYVDKKGN